MKVLEDIKDIFSILHDGTITSWIGDRNSLTLAIECLYLATRINKSFDKFYVELNQVTELKLSTWPNPFNQPVKILTDLSEIFKAELEILSADIKDNSVLISCNQTDTKFNYCGGNLTLNCSEIKIYNQNKQELTIEQINKICQSYWDNFGKK